MKKILSFVMAASMVVSALPMTAYAAGEISATAKIIGKLDLTSTLVNDLANPDKAPELQIKINTADYPGTGTGVTPTVDIRVTLDNAEFTSALLTDFQSGAPSYVIVMEEDSSRNPIDLVGVSVKANDEVVFTFEGYFEKNDVIAINLASNMLRASSGRAATVSVESDMIDISNVSYVNVAARGVRVSIGKVVSIAREERVKLSSDGLKITSTADGSYDATTKFTLSLNNGFKFVDVQPTGGSGWQNWTVEGNRAYFYPTGDDVDITLKDIQIEATSARVGDTARITVKGDGISSVTITTATVGTIVTAVENDKDKEESKDKDVADDNATVNKAVEVVVPIGAGYLVSGGERIALDAPAYINADNYTMIPVRAVARALGLNNSDVVWDAAARSVTINNGDDTIVMVAGQKTVFVNGERFDASSAVEITDSRAFLPMRDLAKALGITDITWDSENKVATFVGTLK